MKDCLSDRVHIFRGESNIAGEILIKKYFSILNKSVNYTFVYGKMLVLVTVIFSYG